MPLIQPADTIKMLDTATQAVDTPGLTFTTSWDWKRLDRELYEAIEFAMGDTLDTVMHDVPKDCGYEVLRLLCRKYNPQYKGVELEMKAKIFGLANDKCKDFSDVVKRVEYIEKIC